MKSGWLEYVEKTGVLYMCHGNWLGDISASQHQRRSQKTAKKTAKKAWKKQGEGGVSRFRLISRLFLFFHIFCSHILRSYFGTHCAAFRSPEACLQDACLQAAARKKKRKKTKKRSRLQAQRSTPPRSWQVGKPAQTGKHAVAPLFPGKEPRGHRKYSGQIACAQKKVAPNHL